jgi:hypothetical protein
MSTWAISVYNDPKPGKLIQLQFYVKNPANIIQSTTTPHVHRNEVIVISIRSNINIRPNLTQSREALGIDRSTDILHHIRDLPTAEDQAAAVAKVQAVERRAMLAQQPQPGLSRLMDYLQSRSVRRGLCTRNFEYVLLYPTSSGT